MKIQHRIPFIALCFLISACGFSPVYGTKTALNKEPVEAALGQIYVNSIENRPGQYLRNALIDRFYTQGRPASPRYKLTITSIVETLTNLDITKSSDTTRGQLRLSTKMVLREGVSDKKLLEQPLSAITSYNILESRFTTRVTEENARKNALDDLARQVEMQLALYFDRTP